MPREHTIPGLDSSLSLLRQLDRRGATADPPAASAPAPPSPSQPLSGAPTPETISSSRRGRAASPQSSTPAPAPAAQIFGRVRRQRPPAQEDASAAATPLAAITPRRVAVQQPSAAAEPAASQRPQQVTQTKQAPNPMLLTARARFEAVNWTRQPITAPAPEPEPEVEPELSQLDPRLLTARQRFEAVNWSREAAPARPATSPAARAARGGGGRDPNSVDSFFSDINW